VENILTENITFHDLYEEYPDFDIIDKKGTNMSQHNIITRQHPMYWYSCPPLMKQWIDMVPEHNWAYGKKGTALQDKIIFQAITWVATKKIIAETGSDRYTVLLEPFNQTAKVCVI
jgi:glutathione-regulated potassium-efflux system ancillary protein KefG